MSDPSNALVKVAPAILWHCFPQDSGAAESVSNALTELTRWIKSEYAVAVETIQADIETAKAIEQIFTSQKACMWADAYLQFQLARSIRTSNAVVYCPSAPGVRDAALSNNPGALFGASIGQLAIVYSPDNVPLIWHETLHTFGAEDCYDELSKKRKRACDRPTCLMQWDVNVNTCGRSPTVCEQVHEKLQRIFCI
jgi:hypothetical protein